MKMLSKITTVVTNNLELKEQIHMDFESYNETSVRGFTSIITVVSPKTIIILVFTTASKIASVRFFLFPNNI